MAETKLSGALARLSVYLDRTETRGSGAIAAEWWSPDAPLSWVTFGDLRALWFALERADRRLVELGEECPQ